MSEVTFQEILKEAQEAAQKAGDNWLANAKPKYTVHRSDLFGNTDPEPMDVLLDVCGNSHVKISDKRTKFAKFIKQYLKQNDPYFRDCGFLTVPLETSHRGRQEMGLHEAETRAAMEVFNSYNVKGVRIWSYID